MSAFAMLPAIREFFSGTVVLGGAITNGAGIRAAEVLGADLAAMRTAFIACPETMASDAYRRTLIESSIDELVLTRAVSGVPAYWLKQSLLAVGIDPESLSEATPIRDGDIGRWSKVWSAGHGVGVIRQVEPAGQLLQRLTQEYWGAVARGASIRASTHRAAGGAA